MVLDSGFRTDTYLSAVNAADAAKEELGVIAPVVEMVEGVKVA